MSHQLSKNETILYTLISDEIEIAIYDRKRQQLNVIKTIKKYERIYYYGYLMPLPSNIKNYYNNVFNKLKNMFYKIKDIIKESSYLRRREIYISCKQELYDFLKDDFCNFSDIDENNILIKHYLTPEKMAL